jgi:signal transduction histidine kinase
MLRAGDEVLVTGNIEQGRYAITLTNARIRLEYAHVPPPPLAVTASMASRGQYDDIVIETEGILLKEEIAGAETRLWLQSNGQTFVAQLASEGETTHLSPIKPGSLLRIRGVCSMNDGSAHESVPFRILMRSIDDLSILSGPPFWTGKHVAWMVMVLVGLALLAHIVHSRIQQWRFNGILEDRIRMAHDLHDTIAQSFAGIGFQLQAIKDALQRKDNDVEQYVDMATSIVADSHENARRAIVMLRPGEVGAVNPLEALRQTAESLTHGSAIRVQVTQEGEPIRLPQSLKQVMQSILHEAAVNAIRHAAPHGIAIRLQYEGRVVSLSVRDDGCGFVPSENRGRGFGLFSMKARAQAQGGSISIQSSPGAGTEVLARFPVVFAPARLRGMWRSILHPGGSL